jgi:Peptidase A4 family
MSRARHRSRPGSALLAAVPLAAAVAGFTAPPAQAAAGTGNAIVTEPDWAGYAAIGSTYTSVSAKFMVPTITCTASTSGASLAIWVGLDGISSTSAEQSGVTGECEDGKSDYSGWYQAAPLAPVIFSNPVKPGDSMTASVTYTAPDVYQFVLTDSTLGWSKTTTKDLTGGPRSSAEVIVEPSSAAALPNPEPPSGFTPLTLSSCTVDGTALGLFDPTEYEPSGVIVSAIGTGSSFSVTRQPTPAGDAGR